MAGPPRPTSGFWTSNVVILGPSHCGMFLSWDYLYSCREFLWTVQPQLCEPLYPVLAHLELGAAKELNVQYQCGQTQEEKGSQADSHLPRLLKGLNQQTFKTIESLTLLKAFYQRWRPMAPKFCRNLLCTSVLPPSTSPVSFRGIL